jgi:cytochrome bd-type quinol oxidase subunit 2
MKNHAGSTIAIVLGVLLFAGSFGQQPHWGHSFAGVVLVVGALAYRSCKKRMLGEKPDTTLRLCAEILAIAFVAVVSLAGNNLADRTYNEPVSYLFIPLGVVIAYGVIVLKKRNSTIRSANAARL